MSRRDKRRHSRPPQPWTEEQKARVEAWEAGPKARDSDPRLARNPPEVLRDVASTVAKELGLEVDHEDFDRAADYCDVSGLRAPDPIERCPSGLGYNSRDPFLGTAHLPRFNRYAIPSTPDPKAVDCPYCVKRPRNLAAHCRAVHPDKPEAR